MAEEYYSSLQGQIVRRRPGELGKSTTDSPQVLSPVHAALTSFDIQQRALQVENFVVEQNALASQAVHATQQAVVHARQAVVDTQQAVVNTNREVRATQEAVLETNHNVKAT